MFRTTLTLLAFIVIGIKANAQYTIDSTFNVNGTNEFTEYAGNVVNGQCIAYTATNDIIIAGRWIDRLTVWKYKQDGQLDPSFGSSGLNSIPMPTDISTWVKDVKIQPDGKIVVLAEAEWFSFSNPSSSQSSIVLARFMPDGSVDSAFNSTGLVNINLIPGYEYHPLCLALDSTTNSIFVGGWNVDYGSYSCPLGHGNWFIAKFQENGALDNTFNSTGFIQSTSGALAQTYSTITPMAMILDIKTLQGGKLVAAGAFNAVDSAYFSLRLMPDGTYDSSYAYNGINVTHIDSFVIASTELTYARILDDQSIVFNMQYVIDGTAGEPDSTIMYVYKKDNAGNTQTSFGTGGYLTFGQISNRCRMTVDNDNRLVYCWYNRLPAGTQTVYFRRLFPNGTPDPSCGTGGILTSEPIPGDTYMNECDMNDIEFNAANDDLTLVALRSATYDPTTFRVLNYSMAPDSPLRVGNPVQPGNTNVYPNPNNGVFTVEAKAGATYRIYNSSGLMVDSGKLGGDKNTLQLSGVLARGIYMMTIQDVNGQVTNKKIVLQ